MKGPFLVGQTTWLPRVSPLRWSTVGYVVAALAVVATSLIILGVKATSQSEDATLLYLVVILAVAAWFGAGPAVTAAVLTIFAYDLLFVSPLGGLVPTDVDDWLALGVYLVAALVTSQLAVGQWREMEAARRREREATSLYALTSLFARESDPTRFLPALARVFPEDFALASLALLAPAPDGQLAALAQASRLARCPAADVRPDGPAPAISEGEDRPSVATHVVALKAGDRQVGVLRVERDPAAPPLTDEQRRFLDVAAQLLGLALERNRLQSEAAEAAALRRADELKEALLNAVTHDLRTPLALIKASAGNLSQKDVAWSDDERSLFAATIEHNVDRLDGIVNNLLDLSRVDAGMLGAERHYYPVAGLVDDVLARLHLLLTDHPVSVEIPDDLPLVKVDAAAIDRVLSNLIENAARHTPPGTPIALTARQEDDTVVVAVSDRGPGIPAAELPRVFERFYQGRPRRHGRRQGLGLGLAVARALVEAHGGRIWIESREGGGVTCSFSLPLGLREPAPPIDGRAPTDVPT